MKKILPLLLALLLATILTSCAGLPRITNEASVQSTASAPTPAPTTIPLPGFTKTLAVGESITATNGVNRAISITYHGTITDAWVCDDGSMTTCASIVEGTKNFDIVIDGATTIGHTDGATITIIPGWGLTPK